MTQHKRQSPLLAMSGDKIHVPGVTAKPLLVEDTRILRWSQMRGAYIPVDMPFTPPADDSEDAVFTVVEFTLWPHDPAPYGPHGMFALMVGMLQTIQIHAGPNVDRSQHPSTRPRLRSV